jgi:hypothetical protein
MAEIKFETIQPDQDFYLVAGRPVIVEVGEMTHVGVITDPEPYEGENTFMLHLLRNLGTPDNPNEALIGGGTGRPEEVTAVGIRWDEEQFIAALRRGYPEQWRREMPEDIEQYYREAYNKEGRLATGRRPS